MLLDISSRKCGCIFKEIVHIEAFNISKHLHRGKQKNYGDYKYVITFSGLDQYSPLIID